MHLTASRARPLALLPIGFALNGCAVIGGIFKAGVWFGVIAVVVVIALIIWAVRAFAR